MIKKFGRPRAFIIGITLAWCGFASALELGSITWQHTQTTYKSNVFLELTYIHHIQVVAKFGKDAELKEGDKVKILAYLGMHDLGNVKTENYISSATAVVDVLKNGETRFYLSFPVEVPELPKMLKIMDMYMDVTPVKGGKPFDPLYLSGLVHVPQGPDALNVVLTSSSKGISNAAQLIKNGKKHIHSLRPEDDKEIPLWEKFAKKYSLTLGPDEERLKVLGQNIEDYSFGKLAALAPDKKSKPSWEEEAEVLDPRKQMLCMYLYYGAKEIGRDTRKALELMQDPPEEDEELPPQRENDPSRFTKSCIKHHFSDEELRLQHYPELKNIKPATPYEQCMADPKKFIKVWTGYFATELLRQSFTPGVPSELKISRSASYSVKRGEQVGNKSNEFHTVLTREKRVTHEGYGMVEGEYSKGLEALGNGFKVSVKAGYKYSHAWSHGEREGYGHSSYKQMYDAISRTNSEYTALDERLKVNEIEGSFLMNAVKCYAFYPIKNKEDYKYGDGHYRLRNFGHKEDHHSQHCKYIGTRPLIVCDTTPKGRRTTEHYYAIGQLRSHNSVEVNPHGANASRWYLNMRGSGLYREFVEVLQFGSEEQKERLGPDLKDNIPETRWDRVFYEQYGTNFPGLFDARITPLR